MVLSHFNFIVIRVNFFFVLFFFLGGGGGDECLFKTILT